MYAAVERRIAALYRIGGHRPGNKRRREQVLAAKYRSQCERRGHLGTVEEREPFLRRQPYRLDPRVCERLFGSHQLAVHPCLAGTDEYARHVRKWRKVAGRAHGAFGRNSRIHVVVDQRAQRVHELEPHARKSFGQRYYLHEHDQAHDVIVEVLANADRVGAYEILLQFHEFVVADVHPGELPETGVDAVDLGTAVDDFADILARLRDRAPRVDTERHFDGTTPGLAELCQRDKLLVDDELHGTSSRPTIGRLRPCSFAHSIASG